MLLTWGRPRLSSKTCFICIHHASYLLCICNICTHLLFITAVNSRVCFSVFCCVHTCFFAKYSNFLINKTKTFFFSSLLGNVNQCSVLENGPIFHVSERMQPIHHLLRIIWREIFLFFMLNSLYHHQYYLDKFHYFAKAFRRNERLTRCVTFYFEFFLLRFSFPKLSMKMVFQEFCVRKKKRRNIDRQPTCRYVMYR